MRKKIFAIFLCLALLFTSSGIFVFSTVKADVGSLAEAIFMPPSSSVAETIYQSDQENLITLIPETEEPVAPPAKIPTVVGAATSIDGGTVTISFDGVMSDPVGKKDQFKVNVADIDDPVTAASLNTDPTKIDLTLQNPIFSGQSVTFSYTAGDIASAEGGLLPSFSDLQVDNLCEVKEPEEKEKKESEKPVDPIVQPTVKLLLTPETVHNLSAWNDPMLGSGMPGVSSQDTIILPGVAAANATLTIPSAVTVLTIQGSTTYTGLNIEMASGHTGLNLTVQDLNLTAPDNKAGIDFGNASGACNLIILGSNNIRAGTGCAGVQVPEGCSLTIDGSGSLTATGGGGAGIGGAGGYNGGTITILGGTITAQGGPGAAGIGGGNGPARGADVIISGGDITATGGDDGSGDDGGAGIGGGHGTGNFGTVTINGGTITANGGSRGAGIGAGDGNGSGGSVAINDGIINATGKDGGAGIGDGYGCGSSEVIISGGTIQATGSANAAGIGGGYKSNAVQITIYDGTINAVGGSGTNIDGDDNGNDITVQSGGAGIGGGCIGGTGDLTIYNGAIEVQGGYGSAGIGSGYKAGSMNLTISGGSIKASGGENGAGIGSGIKGGGAETVVSGGRIEANGGANAQDIGAGVDGGFGSLAVNGWAIIIADDVIAPTGSSGPYTLRILNTIGTSAGVQSVTVKTGTGADCVSGQTDGNGIFGSLYLKNNTDYQVAVTGFKIHKSGEMAFLQAATFNSGTAAAALDFVISNTPSVDDPPSVTTIAASSTQPTTAAVTALDKGYEITARGVVYSSQADPTLENGTTVAVGLGQYGTGHFAAQLTGLTASTTYHVRAYATNEKGTSYGEDLTFTTDSGDCVWTDISANLPASAQGNTSLGDMQFISDTEGWIANSASPEIYYTLNGGRSFKVIKGTLPMNIQAVYSIYFVNRDEGFIGCKNNHVYQTFNGGNSWYDLGSIGTGVTDIDFPSATSRVGFCCGDDGKIYKITRSQYVNTVATMASTSTSSSNNVSKVSTPVENEAWAVVGMDILHYDGTDWEQQDAPSEGYQAIDMVNDQVGWAGGSGTSNIVHTKTGGELVDDQCWDYQWIAGSFNSALMDIFALNVQNVWAVGSGGLVVHTNDGGSTWNPEAQGMTTNMMRAVRFTSTTNGYALGNKGTLLKYGPPPTSPTTGWTKMTAPAGVLTFDRVFADGSKVWMTGDTKIFYSADYPTGGLTPQYENTNLNFNDTCFRKSGSSILGWAVGSGPDGVRTDDASAGSWTDMTLIGSGTARVVHFPTDTVGYAVDNTNTLMKTTDGGQSKWQLVPKPSYQSGQIITVSGVNSLFFVDENTGYAATSDPELRKTTDGGLTWDTELSGSSFQDVFFTDANHGWVVGDSIYRYHNGDWTDVGNPYKNYYYLESVFFLNQNEGWVSGQGGIVMHTIDGGVTWTLMDTEVNTWAAGQEAWLLDIYFVSPGLGYAVGTGGTIIRFSDGSAPPINTTPSVTTGSISGISTTGFNVAGNVTADGGDTVTEKGVVYSTVANPTTADNKVAATSAGTGYFTVDLTGLTAATLYHVRAYAVNGQGTSYGEDKTMTTLTGGGPTVTTGDITDITSKGARVAGYATSSDLTGIIERGVVYSLNATPTLDDIKVPYTADALAGPILVNLTYLAPGTTYHVRAFATDGVGVTNYGEDKTFTTSDGSAYGWTDISANLPETAKGNTALSDMHFISENEGWIVQAVNANIYHTTDGGRTFTTIAPPAETNSYTGAGINAIRMKNSLEGYIAAQNGKIYRTTDGGATWTSVGSGGRPFYAMTLQPGTDTAYACGNIFLVKKVTPTGLQSMPKEPGIQDWVETCNCISFTSSGQGWIGGAEAIVHWVDGMWKADGSMPSSEVESGSHNGICMVNDNDGWCVMDRGYILHTVNGKDWTIQASPETRAPGTKRTLMSTFFLNTLEGWAVGFGGVVLHTVDGGASWNIEAQGMTSNMLKTVQFTSPTNGYALGNNGTLLKYGPLGEPVVTTPLVATETVTGISPTEATAAGNVTSDGGSAVTERGVVYSTSADPTIDNGSKVTADAAGTGEFSVNLTGLTAGTTYHVRAFATNSIGTRYGVDKPFTTESTPVAVINVTINKKETTLTVGQEEQLTATVMPENAIDKSVVWTIQSESESGSLTVVEGLITAKKTGSAVVRATSASNSEAYDECSVTVNAPPQATLTGIAVTPKTVNLQVNDIQQMTVTAYYSDQSSVDVTADSSYTFSLAGVASISAGGLLNARSTGITVLTATYQEKQDTADVVVTVPQERAYLSNLTISEGTLTPVFSSEVSDYTDEVKNSVTSVTVTPTASYPYATISVQDQAVASGSPSQAIDLKVGPNIIKVIVTAQELLAAGEDTTSQEGTMTYKIVVTRAFSNGGGGGGGGSSITAPAVITNEASALSSNSAVLNGAINSRGGAAITAYGFSYKTQSSEWTQVQLGTDDLLGSFSYSLKGLTANTEYYCKAYATNSQGTFYGVEMSFLVLQEPEVKTPADVSSEPSDLSGHWAHDCIIALIQHGIIKGYPDGTIRPEQEITRAEAAMLLVASLGLQDYELQNEGSPYNDELPAWAQRAILICGEKSLMKGYLDGTFKPEQQITRAEMCVALIQAYPQIKEPGFTLGFADLTAIPEWALAYVELAAANKMVSGYPDNTFQPESLIKRGEAFSIICRLQGYHQEHNS